MVGLGKFGDCASLWLHDRTYRGYSILLVACMVVLATLVESQAKVGEMSLFLLPRFLDALWNFLKRRGLVSSVPGGKVLMFSLATSVLTYCYEHEVSHIQPEHLRSYYISIMRRLLGQN
jgi:hypothetical protein